MYKKNKPWVNFVVILCYLAIVGLSIAIMALLPVIYWSLFNEINTLELILRVSAFIGMGVVMGYLFKQVKVLNDLKFKEM